MPTVYTYDDATHVPFGQVQGYAPGGIPAYSNYRDHFFSGERSLDGCFFCGFKYQCVEFARRWLFERKGLILPEVNWACHIYGLKEVHDAATAAAVPVRVVRNGGSEKPEADALIIYPSVPLNIVGHVGVITEVGDDYVCVCDQNYRFHKWSGPYAYKLKLQHDHAAGTWTIVDDLDADDVEVPLGWVTFPGVPNRESSSSNNNNDNKNNDETAATALVLHPSLRYAGAPAPVMRRVTFVPQPPSQEPWLDMQNAAEKLFAHEFGTDLARGRLHETQASYYEINQELYMRCVAYGQQLHTMFLEATGQVIESDELLRVFAIPEVFWPRLRRSWARHRTYLTGRFDFAYNAATQQVKCFEYNADSAATLLECGRIQGKWGHTLGLDTGASRHAGFWMDRNLRLAWSRCGAVGRGRVHFCVDKDAEEQYTALYALEAAAAVGLDTKLCVLFDEFRFDEHGRIVDRDGVVVRTIWKTWMWESAFADYFAAQRERGPEWRPSPGDKVRLCDLLLGSHHHHNKSDKDNDNSNNNDDDDDDVLVFEPMWKVIPSNKAILPLLYRNHPDHPALLKTSYELTSELRRGGYVQKPIVGRVGRNVTITAGDGSVQAQSDGNFGERDMVYQELFDVTSYDDYYPILGVWVVGESVSGAGVREDKKMITGVDSPFASVRIAFDRTVRPITHSDADKMVEDE